MCWRPLGGMSAAVGGGGAALRRRWGGGGGAWAEGVAWGGGCPVAAVQPRLDVGEMPAGGVLVGVRSPVPHSTVFGVLVTYLLRRHAPNHSFTVASFSVPSVWYVHGAALDGYCVSSLPASPHLLTLCARSRRAWAYLSHSPLCFFGTLLSPLSSTVPRLRHSYLFWLPPRRRGSPVPPPKIPHPSRLRPPAP